MNSTATPRTAGMELVCISTTRVMRNVWLEVAAVADIQAAVAAGLAWSGEG